MKKNLRTKGSTTDDLLRDMLIIQLGLAGLTQHQIRKIVGVDIHRVNSIVKHLKIAKQHVKEQTQRQY